MAVDDDHATTNGEAAPIGRDGLVRCEVTGKMCRPEDAVVFRGRVVSAEGKNILLRTLTAGGVVEVLPRPSFAVRLLSYVIDNVVVVGIRVAVEVVFDIPVRSMQYGTPMQAFSFIAAVKLGNGLLAFGYDAILHGVYGKSLGKMACGCRVVKMDGTDINGKIAQVRSFWKCGLHMIPDLLLLVFGFSGTKGIMAVLLLAMLPIVGFSIANAICLVTEEKFNRALHDRLAGTRVVMDRG